MTPKDFLGNIPKVGDEYKALIELGLAIEAPDNMYNAKKQ